MATTLADLRSRVRTLTGIQSTSVVSDAELTAFINEAQSTVLSTADWPFLRRTATVNIPADTDTVSVSIPGTAQRVLDVFVSTSSGSKPWQLLERAAPYIIESDNGTPTEFTWNPDTSTLGVFPASDEPLVATVRVVLDPAPLTSGPDTTAIPDQFVHAVSYLAASRLLDREGDETDRSRKYMELSFEVTLQMRRTLMSSARGSVIVGGRRTFRRSARRGAW